MDMEKEEAIDLCEFIAIIGSQVSCHRPKFVLKASACF